MCLSRGFTATFIWMFYIYFIICAGLHGEADMLKARVPQRLWTHAYDSFLHTDTSSLIQEVVEKSVGNNIILAKYSVCFLAFCNKISRLRLRTCIYSNGKKLVVIF